MENRCPILVLFAVISATAAQTCGRPAIIPKNFGRIIGGVEAIPGSWPWLAHIGHRKNAQSPHSFGCGATVISNRFVLTAAHCLRDADFSQGWFPIYTMDINPANYVIRVGQFNKYLNEPTAQNYRLKRITVHEKHDHFNHPDDIALLEIDGTIAFSTHVSPICLPSGSADPAAGLSCMAVGWGLTDEDDNDSDTATVHQVRVNAVDRATCSKAYQGGVGNEITPGMFCAASSRGGEDTCQGDSGGPLACKNSAGNYVLEGIVSWGKGCGARSYPGVYTRTGYYINWINQKMATL